MAGASDIRAGFRGGVERRDAGSPLRDPDLIARFRMIACVCVVRGSTGDIGSGVLIGDDLVLTCHHVVDALQLATLTCRFNEGGRLYALKEIVTFSRASPGENDFDQKDAQHFMDLAQTPPRPFLDYAVLRLAEKIGSSQPGYALFAGSSTAVTPMGWIPAMGAPLANGVQIKVTANTEEASRGRGTDLRKQVSASSIAIVEIADGLRFRHRASTTPGSSGSPVFDINDALVAIHNAGWDLDKLDDKPRAENQLVPLARILADIEARDPDLRREIADAADVVPRASTVNGAARAGVGTVEDRRKRDALNRGILALLDRSNEAQLCMAGLLKRTGAAPSVRVIQVFYDGTRSGLLPFRDRLNMLIRDKELLRKLDMSDPATAVRITGCFAMSYISCRLQTSGCEDDAALEQIIYGAVYGNDWSGPYAEVQRMLSGRPYDEAFEEKVIGRFVEKLEERFADGNGPVRAVDDFPLLFLYDAPDAYDRPPRTVALRNGQRVEVALPDVVPRDVRSGFLAMAEDWLGDPDLSTAIAMPSPMAGSAQTPMSQVIQWMRDPVDRVRELLQARYF